MVITLTKLFSKMEVYEITYDGFYATYWDDDKNWYIDFNTGLGEAIYPKCDWDLLDALRDQANIQ